VAYSDDIKSARDNLAAELKNETARRLALTAAGNPPPTTYHVGGKSVSWNEYVKMMAEQIQSLTDLANAQDDPWELPMNAYT